MNINLPPDNLAYIDRLVQSGQYPSAEAVIVAGIRLLEETEALRDKVAVGIAQANAGDLLDHESVFSQLRARANAARAQE